MLADEVLTPDILRGIGRQINMSRAAPNSRSISNLYATIWNSFLSEQAASCFPTLPPEIVEKTSKTKILGSVRALNRPSSMNWFDICLLAIIFISAVSGLRTGLARVLFHLIATCAGLLLALWCYGIAADSLMTFIHQPVAARIAGFCLIFLGVMIVGSLVGWVVARFFKGIGLAWLDHLLGGAAGLIRGALLVAISVALVLAFTPIPAPEYINQSRVLPYATSVSAAIVQMAPQQIREGFTQQLDKLKQLWVRPSSKDQRIV